MITEACFPGSGPEQPGPAGTPFSGLAFDEFTAFLHGSKRVEIDQRVTQSLMREEEQDGAPPHHVDLDRGVVFLNRPDGDSKN